MGLSDPAKQPGVHLTNDTSELPVKSAGSTSQHHTASTPSGPSSLTSGMSPGEGPSKCTWSLNSSKNNEQSPHKHIPLQPRPKICRNALDIIGNTPMVQLNNISKLYNIQCELVAKCEYFNAGGSVKDRIGKRMIEDAEAAGRIKPGDTLIEPTSGNTGIGLALSAAIKGYRCIITLPEKMSQEKVDVLKALGAEIIRTPTEAAWDSPESHIGVAQRLQREIPNSHILDQYSNPSNPLAHYDGTAEEMLQQCDNKIDCVVLAAGTGGTITGLARKIREKLPSCKIVGVDPYGSILALPNSLNTQIESYKVEGIGYDFVPDVLDRSIVDEWVKTNDRDSFIAARQLIKYEGLLVGGSAGSALVGALHVAKQYSAGQRVVVLLADSVRNYMSKFLNDQWLESNNLKDIDRTQLPQDQWANDVVSDIHMEAPITVTQDMNVRTCINILNQHGFDQIPCVDRDSSILGVVALGNLTSQITSGRVSYDDPISKALYKQFRRVSLKTTLGELSRIFDVDHFALVATTQRQFQHDNTVIEKSVIYGVVTRIDLLNYISKQSKQAHITDSKQ